MRFTTMFAAALLSTTAIAGPFDAPVEEPSDIEICQECPINVEVFLPGLDGEGIRFAGSVSQLAKRRSQGLTIQFYTLQLLPRVMRPGETMPIWPDGVKVVLDRDGVQARRRGVSRVPALYVEHNGQRRIYAGTAGIDVLRDLLER